MAPAVREFVAGQIAPLDTRIQELEQRLRATENTSVSFRGVWQEGKAYGRGAAVTLKGSL